MLKSLAARIVFAAKDHADAREISDELGFTTVRVRSLSMPVVEFGSGKGRRSASQTVSEQRRALLLPQEVKTLGSEEAIIFYEGLRPIRCRKIRYYQDRRFLVRLRAPPEQAAPETLVSAAPSTEESSVPERMGGAGAAALPTDPVPRDAVCGPRAATREATAADLSHLESLTLEDFAVDFTRVQLPEKAAGERLTSQEMQAAVESFLETLRTA